MVVHAQELGAIITGGGVVGDVQVSWVQYSSGTPTYCVV